MKRLRGVDVLATVRLDRAEVERRREAPVDLTGASSSSLSALLRLSIAEPCRLDGVPEAVRSLAETWPGVFEDMGGGWVRRAVVPLGYVETVAVPSASWRSGLRLAGRFAPYCTRQLVLESVPRDLGLLTMEAGYWGVGVDVLREGEVETVVEAEPFRPSRYSGASWMFAELAAAGAP